MFKTEIRRYALYHNEYGYYCGSRNFTQDVRTANLYKKIGHLKNAYHQLCQNFPWWKENVDKLLPKNFEVITCELKFVDSQSLIEVL